MILPGKTAISRGIILNLTNPTLQIQPCGIDLSLRKIFSWTSAGTVDFSNQFRAGSRKEQLEFTGTRTSTSSSSSPKTKSIHLSAGNYMVEFHEEVNMPLDIMGQVFVRSSLWRMGALLSAGVVSFFFLFFKKKKKSIPSFCHLSSPPSPIVGLTHYLTFNLSLFSRKKHQMDSGYQGAVGGLLQVLNPHGIVLHEHARLAQMVFHVMAEKVEGGGYSGVYQGAKGL